MPDLFLVPMSSEKPPATSPPDAAERAAALDIRNSFIVEAPAGSGKTGLLIQRLLKLLADPGVTEPEQVMAVTFTNKATAELVERVMNQLELARLEAATTNPFEAETRALATSVLARGWNLLDQPDRLRIRTIDSICAEIARSLPVLSGSGGQLAPIPDAAPLHHEAAHRTFMQLGGPDPALNSALRTVLLHRDGNLGDCTSLLANMLQWRDQWGELVPLTGEALTDEALDTEILPKLQAALDHAICAALTRLVRTIPADILSDLTLLAARMGESAGYNGGDSPLAICRNLNTSPGETAEHLDHWRALIHLLTTATGSWRKPGGLNGRNLKFDYDRKLHHPPLVAILDSLSNRDDILSAFDRIQNLPPARYPAEQWKVARALFRMLRHALLELQLVFASRRQCDFAEQALLARTALEHDPQGNDLATALGMKLQHLLVDEMQDTSTSQYELIERLTQGFDGRSQTVFLVGDPKQSIYRFRQARVERFLRTLSTGRLGDLSVQPLHLTANFRSQPDLVGQFNDDFSRIFPAELSPDHPEEVAFAAAAPTRSATKAAGRVWHIATLPSGSDANVRQQQSRSDAQQIRTIIQQWRTQKPGCSIAILVRSRSHLPEIVAALKQSDPNGGAIPFRAVNIDPLADRPEVLDLFALTRALLHPADRAAWLAILHAPWCGLNLADLHMLAGADDDAYAEITIADLLDQRGELLSPDGCQRLERLWLVMQAARKLRARLTTAQWVERTWRSLGGDTWLDPEATANALSYLQLLDQIEAESSGIDLELLQSRMKALFAQSAPVPGAVDLMTIHGAKGLEWDVVIVPALERRGRSSTGRFLNWLELDAIDPLHLETQAAAPLMLAPITSRGEDTSDLNNWLNSIDKGRETAERRRLLYVACTRAREELHLFASPKAKSDGSLSVPADSLLAAAWPAVEDLFANASPMPAAPSLSVASFALAAAAAEPRPALLERLPSTLNLAARFAAYRPLRRPTIEETGETAPQRTFARPEGGVSARSFGNAVHAFLELLSRRIATGEASASLLAELPQWTPRIAAVLRADGLPPAMVDRLTQKVQSALQNTLTDPIGQWIIAAHANASTERALTAWQTSRTSIRLDRLFPAGPEPLTRGNTHLWIVDFKTTTHGKEGLEAFLQHERATYAPQMQTYTQVLTAEAGSRPIHTLLYYPLLRAYTWWNSSSAD